MRLSFFSTLASASTLDFLNLNLDFDIHLTFELWHLELIHH